MFKSKVENGVESPYPVMLDSPVMIGSSAGLVAWKKYDIVEEFFFLYPNIKHKSSDSKTINVVGEVF